MIGIPGIESRIIVLVSVTFVLLVAITLFFFKMKESDELFNHRTNEQSDTDKEHYVK